MTHEELAALIAQSLIDAQVHADSAQPLSPERYAARVAQDFKDRGLIITTAKELATEFSAGLREQRTKVAKEIRQIDDSGTRVNAPNLRAFIERHDLSSMSGIADVVRAVAAEVANPA